ncbi:polyhydroxyalkanoate biosynthesis repressor PhaR [Neobacillus drentensis]|uniref:polyhydroxyalkanoate biosynthesis repressor PhaR n=1 Tax=Neobacillus drentensis TaxID=220684 RepID=UPI002FFE4070
MAKEKMYDPYEGFKQISEMWEKQINGLLFMAADNNEFVRLANSGLGVHSRYMEILRKNQELLAGIMNIPTKKDVANVANLSIQAEGKMDILEEQIWKLQDGLSEINKENLALFQEMVKMFKQMQVELQKTIQEVSELKKMKDDFQEIRKDLVDIKIIQVSLRDVREELEEIKETQKEILKMKDLDEKKTIHTDIEEVKLGLGQLTEIKNELALLKGLVGKESPKGKAKEKELVTTV